MSEASAHCYYCGGLQYGVVFADTVDRANDYLQQVVAAYGISNFDVEDPIVRDSQVKLTFRRKADSS